MTRLLGPGATTSVLPAPLAIATAGAAPVLRLLEPTGTVALASALPEAAALPALVLVAAFAAPATAVGISPNSIP